MNQSAHTQPVISRRTTATLRSADEFRNVNPVLSGGNFVATPQPAITAAAAVATVGVAWKKVTPTASCVLFVLTSQLKPIYPFHRVSAPLASRSHGNRMGEE